MDKVSAKDMARHLEAAIGGEGLLYCFLEDGNRVIQVPLSMRSLSPAKGEFTAWVDDESCEILGALISGSGKLSLLAHGPGVYFQAQVLGMGENQLLRFKMPEGGRFFDRREKDRRELSGPMEVRFNFRSRSQRKLCFDIHEDGMSIVLTREEAQGLRPGTPLPNISVVLGKSEETVMAEVVSARKVAPRAQGQGYSAGVRVSFKFKSQGERFSRLIALVRAQAFAH